MNARRVRLVPIALAACLALPGAAWAEACCPIGSREAGWTSTSCCCSESPCAANLQACDAAEHRLDAIQPNQAVSVSARGGAGPRGSWQPWLVRFVQSPVHRLASVWSVSVSPPFHPAFAFPLRP